MQASRYLDRYTSNEEARGLIRIKHAAATFLRNFIQSGFVVRRVSVKRALKRKVATFPGKWGSRLKARARRRRDATRRMLYYWRGFPRKSVDGLALPAE